MGNGYNHHQNFQRSTFLPMLCSRSSIKDVYLPKWEDRSASFSDDPSSPRVSCMGQIKRNNKVIAYPTSSHRFTTNHHNNIKYSKLKKLFSGKNLISRREMIMDSARGPKFNDHHYVPISIVDMDPPLPVIKKVQEHAEGRDEVNLWKRRSGGASLKCLQIQQIHLPNNHFLQPSNLR